MKINQNNLDIYYIYDYIPSVRWNSNKYDGKCIRNSERLSRYKKKDKTSARNFFTSKLKEAIIEFSNNYLNRKYDEIALFAVPPSKVGKFSSIRCTINEIVEDKHVISNLNNIKKIHNCSNVLFRSRDVKTSHSKEDRRAYKFEHVLSIASKKDFSNVSDKVAFIILDDITTTGIQMQVSRDILIDYYANEDNIYMFAIGATIR